MSEVVHLKRRGRKPAPASIKDDRAFWSEDEKRALENLRSSGETFGVCAERLNRTRNACIAQWDRMTGRDKARNESASNASPPLDAPSFGAKLISLGGPEWSRPRRYQA